MIEQISVTSDIKYLALFSLVLILPKILLRFKIPSGITALMIGTVAINIDSNLHNEPLFRFLAQIGITSLFLFAGLEVNFKELKEDRLYISKYLTITFVVLFAITIFISQVFNMPFQESLIFALGIFTPSAGFIINSLHSFNLNLEQEYWIKSKAISKEVVSILLLFFAMQADNIQTLLTSLLLFAFLIISLPFLFKFFFRFISPYAPNSEVPLLIVLSLLAGVISKEIGAYYLVGAFAVGLIGSNFKKEIIKDNEEALFSSLSNFFTMFLPFYFFSAGMKIKIESFTFQAFGLAILLFIIFVPIRIVVIRYSIRKFMGKICKTNADISLSLMPTLIFGLVIFSVLAERHIINETMNYSLLMYTLMTSIVPAVVISFRKKS